MSGSGTNRDKSYAIVSQIEAHPQRRGQGRSLNFAPVPVALLTDICIKRNGSVSGYTSELITCFKNISFVMI
jgi:hypothetical protein